MSLKIGFGLESQSRFQNGKEGQARVDIQDEESLKRWGEVLHLSREELIRAVETFGPLVRDIRIGLRGQESKAA